MPKPETDKIKKAITWIRTSLRITERTTNPGTITGEIRPVLDVLGWDALKEPQFAVQAGTDVSSISGPTVPAGVIRLLLEASIETSNTALVFVLWIDHVGALTSVGVMRPLTLPVKTAPIKVGLERVLYMVEGDSLRGRSDPATGVGETLTLRQRFIDLPIGEYIQGF